MEVTGLMFYYYFVCHRKLWYFVNEINMEQNSELVEIGKILDENSYGREKKSILIDNTINIDFIRGECVLHEIKKTKAIEEASIWQVKYYMYYLSKRGVKNITAVIDLPLMKQTKEIFLEEGDMQKIEEIIKDIEKILQQEKPPSIINEKTCNKCAYYDLCYV